LNHITDKMCELKTKAETFWEYVKKDKESWDSHYEDERALKKAFSRLSKMIETTRKARNDYEKTLRRIKMLWESNEKKFARNQFVQLLRSMRRCALQSLSLNDVRRVVRLTIKDRLMNLVKEMSTSKESINRDWIRVTNEEYDSLRIEFAFNSNSQLTTLSSSLSFFMRFIMSLSFVARSEKKKNRKTIFVVLFSSILLSSIEKEKNQRTISVDFFLDRASSSFSLTSSFNVSESSLASSSISSWSSSTLRNITMMSKALLKNEDDLTIHLDESLLAALIHSASSSFVLSFDSFFFVSIVFASSFSVSRSRKKVHESFSSALKKRSRLTNDHCDCTLSSKWLEDLKNARCVESARRTEHLLSGLYYLDRQICKKHINQLKHLFELLSIENFVEMKKVLWELLKFDERVEIFKIESFWNLRKWWLNREIASIIEEKETCDERKMQSHEMIRERRM
jgi:hypothetical protein